MSTVHVDTVDESLCRVMIDSSKTTFFLFGNSCSLRWINIHTQHRIILDIMENLSEDVILRTGKPREIVEHLKSRCLQTASGGNLANFTSQFDAATAGGSISPRAFVVWIEICTSKKNNSAIVAGLRQQHSKLIRNAAIRALGKALRRADTFASTWEDLGRAKGLADLMSHFSVCDVKNVCNTLARTALAMGARTERQHAISQLIDCLDGRQNTANGFVYDYPVDPRPLQKFYMALVLASTDEYVQEWEQTKTTRWTARQRDILFQAHSDRYENKFLDEIFSVKHKDTNFNDAKHLIRPNLVFSESILLKLGQSHELEGRRIPRDIMASFIFPLLKRLSRHRVEREHRARIFGIIVDCFERHGVLAEQYLDTRQHGLIDYASKQWDVSKDGQKEIWYGYLVRLVALLPSKEITNLSDVEHIVKRVKLPLRFTLLRLLFKHAKRYGFVIMDDIDGLKRTTLGNTWPVTLLVQTLDNESAISLFEWLSEIHPCGDFLGAATRRYDPRVWMQTCFQSHLIDPEIVRCFLIRNSNLQNASYPKCMERALALIEERKKKALQSRTWEDRAFWAKSALLLSLAVGMLDKYGETLLWARRFNKDALTVKELYARNSIKTEEGLALLSALPLKENKTFDYAAVQKDILRANDILLSLLETSTMVAREPSFQQSDWVEAFKVPEAVVHYRIEQFDSLRTNAGLGDVEISELVCKPTIDMLLQAEVLLLERQAERGHASKSALPQLGCHPASIIHTLAAILNPSVLADLVSHFLVKMAERLEPKRLEQQMSKVMMVVRLLAEGDQPSLACPLIREIVLHGGQNSSWHRTLINVGFLSSLPATTAREFLFTIADAIKEMMREQNLRHERPGDVTVSMSDKSAPTTEAPAVKVTTVKMLAQILHGALFIDRASSCNILIGLLVHAKHIDIQHAITDSLLSTLGESTSTVEVRTQILDALEAHVVPVAGRLSERYPMTEAVWATAAAPSNPVPDIGKDSSLLTLLNYFAKTSRLKEQENTRLVHLILGTQEQSAANNARWMTLFLEKNGFSLECNEIQSELPIGPVNLDLFVKLAFDWTPYMTLSSLEKLKRLVLLNLEPPPAIIEINEAIRRNPDLVRSDAGQHWLSQFGNSVAGALNHGVYQCIDILARRPAHLKTQVRDGIIVETMQEFVLDVARVLIRNDEVELLENLVTKHLAPSWESGGNYLARWKITTLPLLQQLVCTIEEYRTEKWQSNPKRTPTALPDSMQLRARMLPLPYGSRDEPASDDDINAFAAELSQLIEETTATGRAYHKAWQTLKEVVGDRPRKVEFARFAMAIGGLDSIDLTKPSLADHLRIELAGYFLTKSGACQGGTEHLPTDRLVARWRGCEVEEFRLVGNSLAEKARGAGR